MDVPEGTHPLGVVVVWPVWQQATKRKSAPFRAGAIISCPVPAITVAHLHFPLSRARRYIEHPCWRSSHQHADDILTGFPRSAHAAEPFGFCLSAGGTNVSMSLPRSETAEPHPFRAGPVSRLGHFGLATGRTAVRTYQPCRLGLAPTRMRFPGRAAPPRGSRHPVKGCIHGALRTGRLPVPHSSMASDRWRPGWSPHRGLPIATSTIACAAFAAVEVEPSEWMALRVVHGFGPCTQRQHRMLRTLDARQWPHDWADDARRDAAVRVARLASCSSAI